MTPLRRLRGFRPPTLLLLPLLLLVPGLQGCGEDRERGASRRATPIDGPEGRSGLDHARLARGPEELGYVGTAACAECHGEIAQVYASTPKARALSPFQAAGAPEHFDPQGWVHDPLARLSYRASLLDGELWQEEVRNGDGGDPVYRRAHPASLVIGSGQATRSYLLMENGSVTQMPLTWYSQSGRWDLSPGYHEANDRFSRRIGGECLYCHTDPVTTEPFTQNTFRDVPLGIGCERCHGPGRDHVEARRNGTPVPTPDPTIVNPAHLGRTEAMASCQQCHLAGVTVVNPGLELRDFRPGMPLEANRRVFVPELQFTDPEWVGIDSHPLRLARSACFQDARMTCSTCHLPHTAPEAVTPGHYDGRCLSCHLEMTPTGAVCGREGAEPHGASDGGCVGCHLSQGGTSDVPHVTFTDHWIRRVLPPPRDPSQGRPAFDDPTPLTLVEATALGTRASAPPPAAALGIAYLHFWETMHRVPEYILRSTSAGEQARREGTLHGEARLAMARALLEQGRVAEAQGLLVESVREAPDGDPWPSFLLGSLLLERRGSPGEALPFLRQAVTHQPRFGQARLKLAEALVDLGRHGEAEAELAEGAAMTPHQEPRAWFNLGILRGMRGDEAGARDAFRRAGELDPDLLEAHLQYGALELNRGELEPAEAAFRRALAAAPQRPEVHGNLALLALARGQEGEARRHLARLLELDPENPQARALLAGLDGDS